MTTEQHYQAEIYIDGGISALKQGFTQKALESFQAALKIEPSSAIANHQLGSLLLDQGYAEGALPHLQVAVRSVPSVEYVIRLAECLEALNDLTASIACYKAALSKQTNNAALWTRYANLLDLSGDPDGSEYAYDRALMADSQYHSATIGRAQLIWKSDKTRALSAVRHALLDETLELVDRTKLLYILLLFTEWSERLNAGLMPYHATSLDEMFFHNSQDVLKKLRETVSKLCTQDPTNNWARMTDAMTTFASGDLHSAQTKFGTIQDEALSPMAEAVRFDEAFFEALRASDETFLTTNLSEVIMVKVGEFKNEDILYMSCNDSYFDAFAKPLLRSLARCGKNLQVHIHLMDSAEQHTETALRFCRDLQGVQTALSVERPALPSNNPRHARSYFHAIRFIRFYFHLQHYGQTLWMMDVDGLFNRSPEHFFTNLSDADIALRVRPGRLEPWNQFNACLVGIRPTPAARDYLRCISAYIAYFYQNHGLPWGIDQMAMYACFVDAQRRGIEPGLHLLDDKALDYSHDPEGILWCSSGATKVAAFSRSAQEDPTATVYEQAFALYRRERDLP